MNNFFKKSIPAVVVASMLSTQVIPLASASTSQTLVSNQVKNSPIVETQNSTSTSQYSYTYNGVEIGSTISLNDEQLKKLYDQTINISQGINKVTPSIIDQGGSPGMTVAGPEYKTYSNYTERKLADLLVSATVGKIPFIKNLGTISSWVFGVVHGWGLNQIIHPTYVGSWVTKSYDNNSGLYRYYLTVVYYTNDSFNKPIKVQYNEIAASKE
ncbi:hypothetical protein ACE3MZ_01000 [Paenibacillus sp. WLX1005]|uniref:hypothetical protein n=1 Tax=Paenibacillus sp. WLX1005 TaxID=3243766 RepID=UPI00398424A5